MGEAMNRFALSLACLLPVVALASSGAREGMPKPGTFGFNWLDPESAECKKLEAKDIAAMKSCADSANAFGLDLPSKACRVSAKVELIFYDTAEHCQQGLETMQANAP